ncbi:MAG: hypothetical protein WA209_04285, partial [Candidatus Acidiferrales bacterium]
MAGLFPAVLASYLLKDSAIVHHSEARATANARIYIGETAVVDGALNSIDFLAVSSTTPATSRLPESFELAAMRLAVQLLFRRGLNHGSVTAVRRGG